MIILDSDHISFIENEDDPRCKPLRQKLLNSEEQEFCLTAISLEEHMRGWLVAIRRQHDVEKQIKYYDRLVDFNRFFAQWTVQRFDERAAHIFQDLRQQRIRVGSQDLKIASICLANDALLLSRNRVDYLQIPGLKTEDWVGP